MSNFVLGLDLGQVRDYTAVAIAERVSIFEGEIDQNFFGEVVERTRDEFHVGYLHRLSLGTPYPQVIDFVSELVARPELRGQIVIAIDATGVGRAVVDMFIEAWREDRLGPYSPVPVTITGGEKARGLHVPKRDLVSRLQVLLQSYRLKIAEGLPYTDNLVKELLAFRAKYTKTGTETFEAWRESEHDDLVLAVALACWLKHGRSAPRKIDLARRLEA